MSRPRKAASVSISSYGAATLYISNGNVVYLSPNQTWELYSTMAKYFGHFGHETMREPVSNHDLPVVSKERPLLERLQRVNSQPEARISEKILLHLRGRGQVQLGEFSEEIAGKCEISTDEALYQIWALVERHQLRSHGGLSVSLRGHRR